MVTIRVKNAIVPYKITLLSNLVLLPPSVFCVLVPYKITLLSNYNCRHSMTPYVLVPYKITLLSNAVLNNITLEKF